MSAALAEPAVADTAAAVAAQRRGSRRRLAIILAAAAGLVLVVGVIALQLGAAGLTVDRVLAALVGAGDDGDRFVVMRLRLPRVLAAVVVGAAFALAGAVFQSVLRNPLASPDILGIAGGASLGAVWAILVLGLGGLAVSGVAFAGALVIAGLIWAFAWRQGLHGIRFILVGVGFAYLCSSVLAWLLARGEVREAQSVLVWTVGSIADIRGEELGMLAIAVAVLALVVGAASRPLRALALGDDHARGLGVDAGRAKLVLLFAAVGLVAVATSAAGPVAFVALIAPAIARRLQGDGAAALAASVAVGAALTLSADVIGQYAIPGLTAPVGIVTGLIGAPYLLWLLATDERRRRA
ncbi:FecCD family ABC transporter permease [Agromyces archimandritae]|uniref:Iron chelate uptake ABC transporter family permease subunit n=1 Tax=Agromyces archimandritae TaxID=2781962 RepID=A0A975FNG9_9MICO|nr:iron chelate uptake ABC transporter family permease subunit [Agromyces archimandritae]QTX05186.1 iron chelate uptake ABC transporter family permease subunit [Agromyces archimandritae]